MKYFLTWFIEDRLMNRFLLVETWIMCQTYAKPFVLFLIIKCMLHGYFQGVYFKATVLWKNISTTLHLIKIGVYMKILKNTISVKNKIPTLIYISSIYFCIYFTGEFFYLWCIWSCISFQGFYDKKSKFKHT